MIATAVVHHIVGQRCAIIIERDAPAETIQRSGQWVNSAARGACREPPRIHELRQYALFKARVGELGVERCAAVIDIGRAGAIDMAGQVVATGGDDGEIGRVTTEEKCELSGGDEWNAERVALPGRCAEIRLCGRGGVRQAVAFGRRRVPARRPVAQRSRARQ